MSDPSQDKHSPNTLLMQYASLAGQLAVGLLLMVYLGSKLDNWVRPGIPVFIWLLPLFLVIGMIVKVIRDTSKK